MGIQTTTINGKLQKYDDTKYKVAYVGNEKKLVPINTDTTNEDTVATEAAEKEKADKQADKQARWDSFKQGMKNTVSSPAARAVAGTVAQAGVATAKAQGINDPQAGHYAQQAALSEAQAAKMRADEQLARQEAYRNSGDRALTESAKMAEASSAANIRNNQKAMSAEMGGAAATMSAQKNANVDPMQNAMALKQQGYNRQDRATQLGQQAATYQSGAEAQRANATESGELTKQNAVANAEKKRAAEAQAEQNAEDRELYKRKTESEIAKNEGEAAQTQAAAENTTQQTQEAQVTADTAARSKAQDYAKQIETWISEGVTDPASYADYYIAVADRDAGVAKVTMDKLLSAKGGKGSDWAKQYYTALVEKYNNLGRPLSQEKAQQWKDYLGADTPSDSRIKNILSPAGRTLLHIYKGRTR